MIHRLVGWLVGLLFGEPTTSGRVMPPHFWRAVVSVPGFLAAYAGLVKHDGTFCHDVVRTGFRTETTWGKATFLAAVGDFVIHILRWPANRPRPFDPPTELR